MQFDEELDIHEYLLNKVKNDEENISDKLKQPCLYSLYAIAVHSGTMFGGHYIAYVKH